MTDRMGHTDSSDPAFEHEDICKRIFGHCAIEERLSTLIREDALSPVWLFFGPCGVGKRSVALKVAYSVLSGCEYGTRSERADIHSMICSFAHPDLQVVDGVLCESVRAEMSRMHALPVLARKRVVIFNNVHEHASIVANSLLKIIEEPPQNTMIIMIAHDINAVLPTIRSRCAKMMFYPLTRADLQAMFAHQNASEEVLIACDSIGDVLSLINSQAVCVYKRMLCDFSTQHTDKLATLELSVGLILIKRMLRVIIDGALGASGELLAEERAFLSHKTFNIDTLSEMYAKIHEYHNYKMHEPAVYHYFLHSITQAMKNVRC